MASSFLDLPGAFAALLTPFQLQLRLQWETRRFPEECRRTPKLPIAKDRV